MSQVNVDPAELRRFGNTLKHFVGEMQHSMGTLRSQMLGLGQTWRDQEHVKFAEEFDKTLAALNRFVEAANEHVPFLLRKAERIEAYLQQR